MNRFNSHRFQHGSITLGVFMACLWISTAAMPAEAGDQESFPRHSLIVRPDPNRVDQSSAAAAGSQSPPKGSTVPSFSSPAIRPTAPPAIHRKLTKRPGPDNAASAAVPAHTSTTSSSASVLLSPKILTPSSMGTPVPSQTVLSTQIITPARSSTTSIGSAAPVAASVTAGKILTPTASAAQPMAAAATGSLTVGGSRSALNLMQNPAIVKLLQAAPAPAATPPPSTTPPSSAPSTNPVAPAGSPPPSSPSPGQTTGSAFLSWILGSDSDLAGYNIYVGTSSGVYNYPGSPFQIGKVNTYTINNLPNGQTYFFALSAYDTSGNNSALSAEVSKSIF